MYKLNTIIILCMSIFFLLFLPVTVYAVNHTVTTTSDSGAGSLRQTILDAASGDSIGFDATAFPDAITGEIVLNSELLVDKNLTINGGGNVTLNGNDTYRVILVNNSDLSVISVTLDGLNLINGYADDGIAGYSIFDDGGAILNLEDVTISNSSFDSNSSGSNGGAVANVHKCTILNSSFTANSTGNNGGAIHHVLDELTLDGVTFSGNTANAFGGGLYTEINSTTDINNSNFSSNNANHGGAIAVYSVMNITGTTFTGNTATTAGGGLYSLSDAYVTIDDSTISDNISDGTGGGFHVHGIGAVLNNVSVTGNTADQGGGLVVLSTATITNSTIASNSSTSGGGVKVYGACIIINSTVSTNSAGTGSAIYFENSSSGAVHNSTIVSNAGGYAFYGTTSATFNIVSSIIADNIPYDMSGGNSSISVTHSLIENPTGHTITDGDANGNIIGHDPMLGPLKNYGGSTNTHVLLAGSPAIDAGSNPNVLSLDQRGLGFVREDGPIDMGAVEDTYGSTFTTHIVTNTNDSGTGSLRNLIADAGTGDIITFDSSVFTDPVAGTIVLSSGELVIDKALTITGASNVTISAENNSRLFRIEEGVISNVKVTLSGLALRNGNSIAEGGAILNKEALTLDTVTISDSTASTGGGAVYSDEYAESSFVDVVLTNNSTAGTGGAIYNGNYAICSLANTEITNNTAGTSGGGMYSGTNTEVDISTATITGNTATTDHGGGLYSGYPSQLNLVNATVTTNTAGQYGGGIYSHSLNVVDATISGNSAGHTGGGIYGNGGDLTLDKINLTDNITTLYDGGGLYFNVLTATISNSTIARNTANRYGGGIYSHSGVSAVSNSTISNNSAPVASAAMYRGAQYNGRSTATISNSTVASNAGGYAIATSGTTSYATCNIISTIIGNNVPDDASGNISADHSLIESPNGHTITDGDADSNIVGHDPMLGPLKNYGGTFDTHVLLTSSPAIDMGSNPDSLTLDQRETGYPRVVDSSIDMGAVEATYSTTFTTLTVLNTFDAGAGSLRQVIADAVTGDSIIFDATAYPDATTGTITLSSGELLIDKALTITGGDKVTINSNNSNNSSRIFNIDDGTTPQVEVSISGMILLNGSSTAEGGTIRNTEHLTLSSIAIADSTAATSGGAIYNGDYVECSFSDIQLTGNTATADNGGAIYNGNYVDCSMSDVQLTNNMAGTHGGGMYSGTNTEIDISTAIISGNTATTDHGGGLYTGTSSQLSLINATLTNNTAGTDGGAIYSSSLSVADAAISGNSAGGSGGGIYENVGDLTLDKINLTDNTATLDGAGLFFSVTTAAISNSTIARNIANRNGGGIYSYSGVSTISNSTISNNSAAAAGAVYYFGKKYYGSSTGTISNSTVAANAGGSAIATALNGPTYSNYTLISTIAGNNVPDDASGYISADHSLIESPNGHTITDGDANGNIVGHDPMTGPLKNYGGSFETHVLLTGSPAIDMGSNPDSHILDQRGAGYPRVVDSTIDMGAVEATYSTTFTTRMVLNTNDTGTGSLRQVIADAVTGDSIVFDATAFPDATTGTIALSSGELLIDKALTITGGDKVTLNSNNSSRIFSIDDSTTPQVEVSISGMILLDGSSTAEGGAIRNMEHLTLSSISIADSTAATSGGAIYNGDYVECSFVDIQLTGNTATADNGGAIYNGNYVDCSISDIQLINNTAGSSGGGMYSGTNTEIDISTATISGNTATTDHGGGLYSGYPSQLNLANATVTTNTTGQYGGGIYSHSLNVVDATISGNSAGHTGGGIYENGGDLTLDKTKLTDNTAASSGGGLYFTVTTATIKNSTIARNTAVGYGGGIYSYSGISTISNSTISNNSAAAASAVYYFGKRYYGSSTGSISNSTVAANAGGSAIATALNGITYSNYNLISTIVGNNVPDDASGYVSAEHSLIESPNGHTITDGDANGNIVGHDPMLFPLGDYGGFSQTHAIMDGSPVISTGVNPQSLVTDQRGVSFDRVVGIIDIGAIEHGANNSLIVTRGGGGFGVVVGTPGTINCGTSCSEQFDPNISISLTASSQTGSVFTGWSGACSGITTCIVEESSSVEAGFELEGDINLDGSVGLADAVTALQITSGIVPKGTVINVVDISDDGKIGVEEAIFSLRVAAEM